VKPPGVPIKSEEEENTSEIELANSRPSVETGPPQAAPTGFLGCSAHSDDLRVRSRRLTLAHPARDSPLTAGERRSFGSSRSSVTPRYGLLSRTIVLRLAKDQLLSRGTALGAPGR
jgi:hypothetical protein